MSMWDTMLKYTSDGKASDQEEKPVAISDQPKAEEPDESIYKADILFVATNLDSWEADDVRFGYEIMSDVCYRQLDASYYAYLRHKMTQAKERQESGAMKPQVYEELRQRFNTIHAWAMEHIGELALQKATKSFDSRKFVSPSEETFKAYRDRTDGVPTQPRKQEPVGHQFPQDGDWHFTEQVSSEAVAKVDAVREEAIRLGWTQAGLYQNRGRYPFPYGQDYGLVCFLSGGRRIGEVTAQYIEIAASQHGDGSNRFYNPHSDQPWITSTAKTVSPDETVLR